MMIRPIYAKFHRKSSTDWKDIVKREIEMDGRSTDTQPDGRPENINLSTAVLAAEVIK